MLKHVIPIDYLFGQSTLKETVAPDFRPPVVFIKQSRDINEYVLIPRYAT
jgi:hypothetical protein